MNQNLKNVLIIIALLAGVYYFVSPYQNCMRKITWASDEINAIDICSRVTDW